MAGKEWASSSTDTKRLIYESYEISIKFLFQSGLRVSIWASQFLFNKYRDGSHPAPHKEYMDHLVHQVPEYPLEDGFYNSG